MPGNAQVHVCSSSSAIASQLAEHVVRLAREAVDRHGRFTVALSGGSLPSVLARDLKKRAAEANTDKWEVWYADERCVPLTHPDSNHALCHEELYSHLPALRPSRIHTIDDSLVQNPEACAAAYDKSMRAHFREESDVCELPGADGKLPVFDAILLGMGPDGHTASLFPGRAEMDNSSSTPWILHVSESPKPPPNRVTFSLPVLKAARNVVFVCTGDGKKESVKKVLQDKDQSIPSARVVPASGNLHWWIDEAAAGDLDRSKVEVTAFS